MRPYAGSRTRLKLLLIGIDGLLWDKVSRDIAPTLLDLAETGTFHTMTMEVPTLSGPGWSSILTGSKHAQHGVSDNSFIGSRLMSRPDLLSRAFYADQSTTTFAAAGWPPLVDPAGPGPVIHERREQQLAGQHRVVVRDGETYGYLRADAEVIDFADAALRGEHAPDVSFIYLCQVDDIGHLFGLQGAEYPAAIEGVDAQATRLIDRVRSRAESGERWLVVVVTDHGHRPEGGHGGGTRAERASFVIATGIGDPGPQWLSRLEPHALVDLLLAELAS